MNTFFRGLLLGIGFSIGVAITIAAGTGLFLLLSDDETAFLESRWSRLSADEKVEAATALVIGRYVDGPDASKIGVVAEIHRREPSIRIDLKVGEQIPDSKYYPDEHDDRDGIVIFYTDNPGKRQRGLYMYRSRIIGLGDMPLEVLVRKFSGDA
jgi:hypothetical protein